MFDGERVQLVQLERDDPIMPSATYIDRDLQSMTGQAAIDQYIRDNTGRTVEMIPEVVGEVSQFVEHGDPTAEVETSTQKIYGAPVTDSGLQGRLFRGTKRLLGDPRVTSVLDGLGSHPGRALGSDLAALLSPTPAFEAFVGGVVTLEGVVQLGTFTAFFLWAATRTVDRGRA